MKRSVVYILAGLLVLSGLAGCSPRKPKSTEQPPSNASTSIPVAGAIAPVAACTPTHDFGVPQTVLVDVNGTRISWGLWGFLKDEELWVPAELAGRLGFGAARDAGVDALVLSAGSREWKLPHESSRGPRELQLLVDGRRSPARVVMYLGRYWLPLPSLAKELGAEVTDSPQGYHTQVLEFTTNADPAVRDGLDLGPTSTQVALLVDGRILCPGLAAPVYSPVSGPLQPMVPAALLASLGADVRYDPKRSLLEISPADDPAGGGRVDPGPQAYPFTPQPVQAVVGSKQLPDWAAVFWGGTPWVSPRETALALGWQGDLSGWSLGLNTVALRHPDHQQQVSDLFVTPAAPDVERAASELALYEIFWRLPGMPFDSSGPADPAAVRLMAERMGIPFTVQEGATWSDTVLLAHQAYVQSGVAARRGLKWWERVQVWAGAGAVDNTEGATVTPEQEARIIAQAGLSAASWVELFPGTPAYIRRRTAEMHRQGIWYSDNRILNLGYEPELAAAGALDGVCLDLVGRPVEQASMPQEPGRHYYMMSSQSPAWYRFLFERFKSAIDMGVDVITIDNAEGSGTQNCFNQDAMADFRSYLKARYTEPELRVRGVEDVNSFDYGRFLLRGGHRELLTPGTSIGELPLGQDYWVWSMVSNQSMVRRLTGELKAYSRSRYGKEIAFTGNAMPLFTASHVHLEPFDFVSYETFWHQMGWPPARTGTAAQQLLRALGKGGPTILSVQSAFELKQRSRTANLLRLLIADAYSNLGGFFVPHGITAADLDRGSTSYTGYYGDLDAYGPYLRFAQAHPAAYEGLDPVADLGLVFLTEAFDEYETDAYRGAVNLLGETQTQFRVVYGADPQKVRERLTAGALAPFRVLWLDEGRAVTPSHAAVLLDWVRGGGTLLVTGETGGALAEEMKDGERRLGKGRIIRESASLGLAYLQDPSPELRGRWLGLLKEVSLAGSAVAPNAPPTLGVAVYRHRWGTRHVVHLVNYDYDPGRDEVEALGSFTLRLPFSGSRVTLLTPEGNHQGLESSRNGTGMTVTVPGLQIWGVLLIED